jgi:phosphate transport system permease protein
MPAVRRDVPLPEAARPAAAPRPAVRRPESRHARAARRLADAAFHGLSLGFALSVFAVTALIAGSLAVSAWPAIVRFGWRFVTASTWDPVALDFGALPFVYGTAMTSLVALAIAVPLGVGAAICLAELLPRGLSSAFNFLVELLVAVPSVIYGLVAVFVLVPLVRDAGNAVQPVLGWLPVLRGPSYGVGLLTAAIVLAVMIVPFIVSVSREVLLAVPRTQRDGALALGATRWEALRGVVLPYARSGIVGAVFLALGRALGETMAVTMVIGNRPEISASLLAPAYTMPAVLANEFAEATSDLYLSALFEIALLLFVITMIVNAAARLLVGRVAGGTPARAA